MSAIKNIYYDIAILSKLILLLPFVNETDTDFKLLNDSNIDEKLQEFGLDCISIYKIDPCPLESLKNPEPQFDSTPTIEITQLYMPDPEWFKLAAKHHLKPHLRLLLDILLSPILPRTFYANKIDFSENKYSEKLSESFEILLSNNAARSYINSIIDKLKDSKLPLPLDPVLTIEEMEMGGEEVALYLSSLKQLVFANRPSIRKSQISLVKSISLGQYRKKALLTFKKR